jgi:hypothetical protein
MQKAIALLDSNLFPELILWEPEKDEAVMGNKLTLKSS